MSDVTAPILTAHLFQELDGHLLELLESLPLDDWRRPTIVPKWNVKEIVAHLLDTATRRLSLVRDRETAPPPSIQSDRDLVDFVNGLNARGVEVYGRLSPRLLTTLTRAVAGDLHRYLESLDPMAPAAFAVSWAGEAQSLNWFDVARELTERWHHQQQIRLAVNRPGIMTPRLYAPVLECFMRGLPHAYRDLPGSTGDTARVDITGDCGNSWMVQKAAAGWQLVSPSETVNVVAKTTIPQEMAWRIFTKGVSPPEARAAVSIEGDEGLGSAILRMTAIVG